MQLDAQQRLLQLLFRRAHRVESLPCRAQEARFASRRLQDSILDGPERPVRDEPAHLGRREEGAACPSESEGMGQGTAQAGGCRGYGRIGTQVHGVGPIRLALRSPRDDAPLTQDGHLQACPGSGLPEAGRTRRALSVSPISLWPLHHARDSGS